MGEEFKTVDLEPITGGLFQGVYFEGKLEIHNLAEKIQGLWGNGKEFVTAQICFSALGWI